MGGRVAVGSRAGVVNGGASRPGGGGALAPVEGAVRTTAAPLFAPTSKPSSDVRACVPDVVEAEQSRGKSDLFDRKESWRGARAVHQRAG